MSSFQQITMGVICLVAAFWFGSYINEQPAGQDEPLLQRADGTLVASSRSRQSSLAETTEGFLSSLFDTPEREKPVTLDELKSRSRGGGKPARLLAQKQPVSGRPKANGQAPNESIASALTETPFSARDHVAPPFPDRDPAEARRISIVPDFSTLALEFPAADAMKLTPERLPPERKPATEPAPQTSPGLAAFAAASHPDDRFSHSSTPETQRDSRFPRDSAAVTPLERSPEALPVPVVGKFNNSAIDASAPDWDMVQRQVMSVEEKLRQFRDMHPVEETAFDSPPPRPTDLPEQESMAAYGDSSHEAGEPADSTAPPVNVVRSAPPQLPAENPLRAFPQSQDYDQSLKSQIGRVDNGRSEGRRSINGIQFDPPQRDTYRLPASGTENLAMRQQRWKVFQPSEVAEESSTRDSRIPAYENNPDRGESVVRTPSTLERPDSQWTASQLEAVNHHRSSTQRRTSRVRSLNDSFSDDLLSMPVDDPRFVTPRRSSDVRQPEVQGAFESGVFDSVDVAARNEPVRRSVVQTDSRRQESMNRLNRDASPAVETIKYQRETEYRTKANDTLQSISQSHYGTPEYYFDLYLANRDLLPNPATVPIGVDLVIPDLNR